MDVIKKAVHTVNPGQTVVITADQPLYAVLKEIQELCRELMVKNTLYSYLVDFT